MKIRGSRPKVQFLYLPDIDINFLNCYIRNAKVSSVRVPVCKISKDRITHFIYYIPLKGKKVLAASLGEFLGNRVSGKKVFCYVI